MAPCAGQSDCASGAYCDTSSGQCKSGGAIGASCSSDVQCNAGRCVDGICCNTTAAACPLCQSCNVSTNPGTCTFVGTGAAEPHGSCAPNGVCGNTGACAANQTCAQTPAGTTCGDPASCSAGVQMSGRTCDGAGNCPPAEIKSCDQFVCGPTACLTMCSSEADCIAGDYCDSGGNCQTKKAPGAPCGSPNECATGSVCGAEGVCCDNSCSGPCESCKLSTSPGTCAPVPMCGGTDAGADGG
jgi:hypothetical protein